jgi:hypothetical protein
MRNISRAVRVAAIAATAASSFMVAPALAQRLPVPPSPLPGPTLPAPDLPPVPNVPLPIPGQPTVGLPDDISQLPDLLRETGNHQGTMITGYAGQAPNDPIFEPTISPDGRINRYVAYSSSATNIVAGSGDKRNMFLLKRKTGWTIFANAWKTGKTVLVSKGIGGPADGDSWSPSFSGFDQGAASNPTVFAPKCLAFVSDASNLVPGDTNGRADIFIKRLPSGALKRVPTPTAPTQVGMDGRCWEISYIAGGAAYTAHVNGKKVRKISPSDGGVTSEISANGKTIVFERAGKIYGWVLGRGTRLIGAGTNPSSEEWGRFVSYVNPEGKVVVDSITGAQVACFHGTSRIGGGACGIAAGTDPSMTAGGHFIFYTAEDVMTSNVYKDISVCPVGSVARQVSGSAHGNYAVYGCSNGRAYFSYVDPYLHDAD